MTGKEQKPVFELQLYLSPGIKRSGSRHIKTLSLPAVDERFEQVREAPERLKCVCQSPCPKGYPFDRGWEQ